MSAMRFLALALAFCALAPLPAQAHTTTSRPSFAVQAFEAYGEWRYNDPTRGVYGEGLDFEVGALIQTLDPGSMRVVLKFSSRPFRGSQVTARLLGPDFRGGADYAIIRGPVTGAQFWLCGHLLDYFTTAPRRLYAGVGNA